MKDIYKNDNNVIRIYGNELKHPTYTLNDWVFICNDISKDSGYWDYDRSTLEAIAPMYSDITSAAEEIRNVNPTDNNGIYMQNGKPCGISVGLANCVIRIFDYIGHMGWNMEDVMRASIEYNKRNKYIKNKE